MAFFEAFASCTHAEPARFSCGRWYQGDALGLHGRPDLRLAHALQDTGAALTRVLDCDQRAALAKNFCWGSPAKSDDDARLQLGVLNTCEPGCSSLRPGPRADQRTMQRGSPPQCGLPAPTEERQRNRHEGPSHHRAAQPTPTLTLPLPLTLTKVRVGIIGLPNVGKSTLFNALARKSLAQAANFPFCTIEPNVARIGVPDAQLGERLQAFAGVERAVSATIEWVDIAGLAKGASRGEGLGNKFLGTARDCDALTLTLNPGPHPEPEPEPEPGPK